MNLRANSLGVVIVIERPGSGSSFELLLKGLVDGITDAYFDCSYWHFDLHKIGHVLDSVTMVDC